MISSGPDFRGLSYIRERFAFPRFIFFATSPLSLSSNIRKFSGSLLDTSKNL